MRTTIRSAQVARVEITRDLERLRSSIRGTVEGIDTFLPLVGGLEDEDLADLTLLLDEVREMAKHAVTRMTAMRDAVADALCPMIAERHSGEWVRPDLGVKLRGAVRCFATAPSQLKYPEKFEELRKWLVDNGHGDRLDVGINGRYSIEKLDELCSELMIDGKPMPPNVGTHLIAAVDVKRLRS